VLFTQPPREEERAHEGEGTAVDYTGEPEQCAQWDHTDGQLVEAEEDDE
jgi:hypothetical protein